MFATATLAARIERAECEMLTDLATHVAQPPAEGVVLEAVGGGVAVYTVQRFGFSILYFRAILVRPPAAAQGR
jgi:hypothetical protein